MKLLFDLTAAQPLGNVKRHGAGRYTEVIFSRLVERREIFSCYYNSAKWLNPKVKVVVEENKIPLYDIQKQSIESIVREHEFYRVFSAIPGEIANLTCCEVVGTIHDLRFLELPHDSYYYKYRNNSCKEIIKYLVRSLVPNLARKKTVNSYLRNYFDTPMRIITVSEHSKYEILSYIPQSKTKDIKVFYSPNTSSKEAVEKSIISQRYFLSVSGKVWLKNVLRSIIAFDNLVSNGLVKDIRYKITGAQQGDFNYKIKNPDVFDFLGYVEDNELEKLYANAYAFVYPSLSEGFGYPPLEAMRYRVPVIASPISSIAQILDTGAMYFNPFSIEEIMNRMQMILQDSYHNQFSERGYEQYLKIKAKQDEDLDLLIDLITG